MLTAQLGIISWLDKRIGVVEQIESRIRELLGARSKATARAVSKAVNFVREKKPGPFALLVTGEMGEGKNYLAEVIHQVAVENGFRKGELQIVNIVARDNTQDIRADLFGSKLKDNPIEGAFPRAKNGTVVIDEVGSCPPELQNNLLTAISPGIYKPLFGDQEKNEAWVILTTNRPEKIIEELADRCIHIELPPISQRQEDIEILVENVLSKFAPDYKLGVVARLDLKNYAWKNVREIVKVIFETIKAKRAKSYDSLQIGPEEIVWISANQPEGISSQKKESVTAQPDSFSQDTWFSELDRDQLIKLCRKILETKGEIIGNRADNIPYQLTIRQEHADYYIKAVLAIFFEVHRSNKKVFKRELFSKIFGFKEKKPNANPLRVYLQRKDGYELKQNGMALDVGGSQASTALRSGAISNIFSVVGLYLYQYFLHLSPTLYWQ
ncbi:MAG: sigma 54-interacting transcriptional regulator [Deltaproteobacteria bacterium]|nr:sigma 54-interacting transcriptional regulator [Deltaproteobacteria bacterium]